MDSQEHPIIYSETLSFTKLGIIKNISAISLSFMLLFTAYNGLAMLQSSINKEQSMGVISQAVVFISFIIATPVLPKYMLRKLGCKLTLNIAISAQIPYIAANLHPSWGTLVPGAILAGIGLSLLWGSQSTYFNISSFLYCTASQGGVIEGIPANCTSIDELSVKDVAFNANKNVYCIKVSRSEERAATNWPQPSLFDANDASVRTVRNNFDSDITFTYFRRRSSGHEHGFFPPRKYYDDLRSSMESLPTEENEADNSSFQENKAFENFSSIELLSRIEVITPLFFGFHGLLYHSSMVWGNMMSYFVLQTDSHFQNITFTAASNFNSFCGASFCNNQNNELIAEPTAEMRYMLTGISVTLGVLAALLVLLFLDQLGSDREPVNFSLDILMAIFQHSKERRQLLLIPVSVLIGLEQGFYIGDYTKSYIACVLGTYNIGLVTIFYGLTCALSSTFAGLFARHFGRISVVVTGHLISLVTSVFLLLWIPESSETYIFIIAALLWGVFSGIFWSQIPAFYGVLFRSEEDAALIFYYMCCAAGFALSFIYSDFICTCYKLYIIMVLTCLSLLGYLMAERLHYLKNKE